MKSSLKDKTEGTLHELKGKLKQTAGEVTDNPNLEAEGKAENLSGKLQKKVGQVKKAFGK